MVIFNFIVALFTILVTGFCFLDVIKPQKSMPILEVFALSFGLGCGYISLAMFLMSLFNIPFSLFNLLVILIVSWVSYVLYRRLKEKSKIIYIEHSKFDYKSKPSYLEIILIVFIAVQLAYVLLASGALPFAGINEWDSWAIYGIRARIFFLDQRVSVEKFLLYPNAIAHPDYPLLIPLMEGYFYVFMGQINEALAKLFISLFYVCVLIIFYNKVKRAHSRVLALAATFILSSIPFLMTMASIGYADFPLAFFYLVSISYLYMGLRNSDRKFIIISSIFSGLAAWTKNEGGVLALINILILGSFLYKIKLKFPDFVSFLKYTLPIVLINLPWLISKLTLSIGSEFLDVANLFSKLSLTNLSYRLPIILLQVFKSVFNLKEWSIFFIFCSIIIAFRVKHILRTELRFILLSISTYSLAYIFIYVITPNDLMWQLNNSLNRVMFHIVPTLFLLSFLSLSSYNEVTTSSDNFQL